MSFRWHLIFPVQDIRVKWVRAVKHWRWIWPVGSRVNSTPVLHGAYEFCTFRPDDEHCLLPLLLESHPFLEVPHLFSANLSKISFILFSPNSIVFFRADDSILTVLCWQHLEKIGTLVVVYTICAFVAPVCLEIEKKSITRPRRATGVWGYLDWKFCYGHPPIRRFFAII